MKGNDQFATLAARMQGKAPILPQVLEARKGLEDIARERRQDPYRCSKTHCETKPPPEEPPATLKRPMSPLMQCESKAPGVEPPEKKLRTCSDSPPANTPGLSPIREKTFQGGRDWAGAPKFSGGPPTFSSTFLPAEIQRCAV